MIPSHESQDDSSFEGTSSFSNSLAHEYSSSNHNSETTVNDNESSSESDDSEEEEENFYQEEDFDKEYVQQIIGMKDPEETEDESTEGKEGENAPVYYAKFQEKSYRHCRWMTEIDLLITPGGEAALKRFRNKTHKVELTKSLSIPSLLTFDSVSINSQWFDIDRIINHREIKGKTEYLVKWMGLEYEESTWETGEFLNDQQAIKAYFERKSHDNPKKIPSRWVRPEAQDYVPIRESPVSKNGDILRDYQLEGMNWLLFCWYTQTNSILADEMGLGKTVQVITTLMSISKNHDIRGPFLIVAPLSTLNHWKNEFEKWSDFNVVVFHGSAKSRELIEETEMNVKDEMGRVLPSRFGCDVVITTYETICKAINLMYNVDWRYLVADEGHKLKNYKGKRYQVMQKLIFEHCTLLTGTPIQNDISELWSLLHFLQPDKFNDFEGFMAKYGNMTDSSQVQEIQSIIQPLLLRRKKNDVEKSLAPKEETIINVELTKIQKTFYRAFINKNSTTLLHQITFGSLPSLQNLMMQLRKVCNHPFLIKGAENSIYKELKSENSNLTEEELRLKGIVTACGKMILLDKLLPKLKEDGHKVLIFSQMVRVLDIIEDFLQLKKYKYERLDGSINDNDRRVSIDRFNLDPENFVFLLSTKAGGVGINLTSADTVVIYDSDWNPQNDIQAQARCHRIGQTATVKVYRLISRGTYENEMFERASKKLGLDHVVLEGGDMNPNQHMKPDEIENILRNGAYGIFQDDNSEADNFVSADIDQILQQCSQSHKIDSSATGSVFSKATFKTTEGNVEFWSKIIKPDSTANDTNKERSFRKCRKDKIDQENDLDDPENGFRIVHSLIDHGFQYSSVERKVIRIAFSIKHPDDIESIGVLHRIVHCSLDESDDDDKEAEIEYNNYDDLVHRYGEIALTVIEKADKIVTRVGFFARLARALHFVQDGSFKWPEIQQIWENPYSEYALMYGIFKCGWKDVMRIFDEPVFMLRNAKRLDQKQMEERTYELIEILETQYSEDEPVILQHFEPLTPSEWREQHTNLQSKSIIYNHELVKLFNTIRCYGLIQDNSKTEPTLDVQAIKEKADLDHISNDLIQRTIEQLNELSGTVKTDNDPVDFSKFKDLEALHTKVKAKDLLSYSRTIEVMNSINIFVDSFCDSSKEFAAKAPKNIHLPSWWTYEDDISLIFALHQYGTIFVSSWIIDPNFRFRQHLTDDLLRLFEKAAAKEKKYDKAIRPQKLGDFIFLFRKRSRLARAMMVADYVNKKLKKGKSRKNKTSKDNSTDGTSPKEKGRKSKKSQLASKYELVVNHTLHIVSFGEYKGHKSKFGICPVGFTSERLYGDNSKEWFVCSIFENFDHELLFSVKRMSDDDPSHASVSNSPIKSWRMALGKNEDDSSLKLHGVLLFGLSNKKVKEKLLSMKANYKEQHPKNELTGSQPDDSNDQNLYSDKKEVISTNNYNYSISNTIDFEIPIQAFSRHRIKSASFDNEINVANNGYF